MWPGLLSNYAYLSAEFQALCSVQTMKKLINYWDGVESLELWETRENDKRYEFRWFVRTGHSEDRELGEEASQLMYKAGESRGCNSRQELRHVLFSLSQVDENKIHRSSSQLDLFSKASGTDLSQSGKWSILCTRTEPFLPLRRVNLQNFDAPGNTRLKSKSNPRLLFHSHNP